jgi:hypothetical protein
MSGHQSNLSLPQLRNSNNIDFGSLLIPCMCGEKINVTIYDILSSNEVKCTHCNARLKADYEKNEESIKLLQMFVQRIGSINHAAF